MKITKTRKLVTSAILIALAIALNFIKIIHMPLGGSVTLLSMLPIVLISVMFGLKWGFASSFVYAMLHLVISGIAQDGVLGWGLKWYSLLGCFLLDYIIAFAVLGIAGVFRKEGTLGITAGVSLALILRFVSHLLSGVLIFANFDEFVVFGEKWIGRPWLYSAVYNGFFMLPELIMTAIAAAIVANLPVIKKYLPRKSAGDDADKKHGIIGVSVNSALAWTLIALFTAAFAAALLIMAYEA